MPKPRRARSQNLPLTHCHPEVLERFYLAGHLIDIAAAARSKSQTIAVPQVGWSLGLRPFHRQVGRRRSAALEVHRRSRDSRPRRRRLCRLSIPPSNPGPAPDPSTSASSGPVSPDPSSLPNPAPFALPQLAAPQFRADASARPAQPERAGPWGVFSGDWQNQNLLGDMGGLRPALAKFGVTLTILENVETFGNLSGGVKQGFEADGLTTVTLQMDTEKAFGLKGGTLNVSGLQVLGRRSERGQSHGPADPEPTSRRPSAFGFGSSGISRNSATSSTSRSASRASTRNSSSPQAGTPSSSTACPAGRGFQQ